MNLSRRQLVQIALGIYLLTQVLLLIYIQFPQKVSFDEFHYVPSAKQWLAGIENQNWEHPPLGKLFMAAGIGIFGDRPIGWRFFSTVFGALTLSGFFVWAYALFKNTETALLATLLTALNQILYVQSRIGMLDPFMVCFLVWGFAGFTVSWAGLADGNPRLARNTLWAGGASMGLAICAKWAAIIPLLCWIGFFGVAWLLGDLPQKKGSKPTPGSFHIPGTPRNLRSLLSPTDLLIGLVALPVLVYYLPFVAYFGVERFPPYTLSEILGEMQARMYDGQLRVVTPHPYHSDWKTWPLMLRPIWFTFDGQGRNTVRGVLMIGNPLIMWSGLVALLGCAWLWIKENSRAAGLAFVLWSLLYWSWGLVPRTISFYYYYYPCALILSLAIAALFERYEKGTRLVRWTFVGACAGLFAYFFPILAAMKIDSDGFRKWMWFQSWI